MKVECVRLFLNLENGNGGHFLNILSQFAATDKLREIERKKNWKNSWELESERLWANLENGRRFLNPTIFRLSTS